MSDISFNDAMECERWLEQLAEFIKRHFPRRAAGRRADFLILRSDIEKASAVLSCSRGSWVIGHNHGNGHTDDADPVPPGEAVIEVP